MSYAKEALKRGAMGFAVGIAISMTIGSSLDGWKGSANMIMRS